jgi:penicillin-binding protein-related factor A (putative recombinase)
MANPESLFWKQIKTALSDQGYFLTRVETLTVSGVPDVFGIYKGRSFWCELKSNQVSYPALNKYQIVWINRAVKHGATVFSLIRVPLALILLSKFLSVGRCSWISFRMRC